MKMNYNNIRGISLISLVITIIVLLILAGVSLSMIMGESGMFNKANNAKILTNRAQAEEDVRLRILDYQIENGGVKPTLKQLAIYLRDRVADVYDVKLESSQEASLVTSDIVNLITDSTEKLYITKLSIGIEVIVTKELEMESNENIVEISGGNPPSSTYEAYSIGEEVTVGGEQFYVIYDDGIEASEITLLAKYSLNSAATEQEEGDRSNFCFC